MLVNGRASDIASSDKCSYSKSCSSFAYGRVKLPDIENPLYAVKVDCAQQAPPYFGQGNILACQTSLFGNHWYAQNSNYNSRGQNDMTLTSSFRDDSGVYSFSLAYVNASATSSVSSTNSLSVVYPVELVDSREVNVNWEMFIVSQPPTPSYSNSFVDLEIGPTVVIRPSGLDGYFLGICTQCQWSYNTTNNATVVALLNTTQTDPLVQFTIVSAQN